MRKFIMGILVALFLMPVPLWAAETLVGHYAFDSFDNLQVVVKNNETVRINITDDGSEVFFMLLNDGKRWMVGRDNDESVWEAFDFDALVLFMQATKEQMSDISATAEITKDGDQTVGGIAGEAFNVKYPDEHFRLVVTENAEIVTLTNAMYTIFADIDDDELAIMVQTLQSLNKENGKDYGLLQYNEEFTFLSLEQKNYPDSYFNLPENVEILGIDEIFSGE